MILNWLKLGYLHFIFIPRRFNVVNFLQDPLFIAIAMARAPSVQRLTH